LRVEIVLAGFINYADLMVLRGSVICQQAINFSRLQGGRIAAVLNA